MISNRINMQPPAATTARGSTNNVPPSHRSNRLVRTVLSVPLSALAVSLAFSLPTKLCTSAGNASGKVQNRVFSLLRAALPLAEAQDLQGAIAEAKKSKIDFIRVISELEESVAFLERKNEAIQLIGAIPEFERIAVSHGFDNLGGDPLFRLKDDLTRTSIKWLDIRTDSVGAMKIFVRIARPNVNEQFFDEQSNHFYQLRGDIGAYEQTYWRMNEVVQFFYKSTSDVGVKKGVSAQMSDYLSYLLTASSPPIDKLISYYGTVNGQDGFEAVLNYLENLTVREANGEKLKQILTLAMRIGSDLEKAEFFVPTYLRRQPGDILVQALDKLMLNGAAISESTVDQIFKILEVKQIEELVYRVIQTETHLLPAAQVPFVVAFSEKAIDLLEAYGQARDADRLKKHLSRLQTLLLLNKRDFEGNYTVNLGGETFQMTIARTSLHSLMVTMSADFIDYSMTETFYDRESGDLLVSRFYIDDVIGGPGGPQNNIIRLTSIATGAIKGEFDNGSRSYPVSATRRERFTDFLSRPAVRPESVDGSYAGTTDNPSFPNARLVLRKTGDVISGTLNLTPESNSLRITFVNGMLLESKNVFSMVSGETGNGNTVHIRGQVKNGVLEAQYIAGGRKVINLKLRRQ